MSGTVYTYLKFVKYKELENWSVSHILGMNMGFNEIYPMIPIGNVIVRNTNAITIEDNFSYKQITLKTNGGGAVLRDVKLGKDIGTKKQYVVSVGQFIMSKIDARNGAFGVVGMDLDGAVVTADFPVFDVIEDKMTPEYLALISSTAPFVRFAQSCSRGTTNRQRIDVNLFLSQKIPLPTIDVQRTLVSAYNDKISHSKALEKQAAQMEQDIEDYLLSELGIKQKGYKVPELTPTMASEPQIEYVVSNQLLEDRTDTYHLGDEIKKKYKYLELVRFKDVNEWGYDRITGNNKMLLYSNTFHNKALSQLLEINPNTSFSEIKVNDEISFIPMECISDKYGEWKEKRICKVDSSKGYTKFMNGDLIWAKITPCMQNGKSAIVNGLKNGYGCGSTEFYVLRNHSKNINMYYIHYILRLPIVLKDAMKSFTGSAGQQRVPKTYLENLSIPVPELDIQNAIVEHINKQKEQIKQLKQQAENLRKEALEEFEKEIFE